MASQIPTHKWLKTHHVRFANKKTYKDQNLGLLLTFFPWFVVLGLVSFGGFMYGSSIFQIIVYLSILLLSRLFNDLNHSSGRSALCIHRCFWPHLVTISSRKIDPCHPPQLRKTGWNARLKRLWSGNGKKWVWHAWMHACLVWPIIPAWNYVLWGRGTVLYTTIFAY